MHKDNVKLLTSYVHDTCMEELSNPQNIEYNIAIPTDM